MASKFNVPGQGISADVPDEGQIFRSEVGSGKPLVFRRVGNELQLLDQGAYSGDLNTLPIGNPSSEGLEYLRRFGNMSTREVNAADFGKAAGQGGESFELRPHNLNPNSGVLTSSTRGVIRPGITVAEAQKGTPQTKQGGVSSVTSLPKVDVGKTPPLNGESFREFRDRVTGDMQSPQAPSLTDIFKKMQEEQGILTMEDELSTIKGETDKLVTDLQTFKRTEQAAGGQTQGFTTGRISEQEALVRDKLFDMQRREQILVDRLNTKNQYISNVLKLTGEDYDNVKQAYDTNFTQALQMYSVLQKEEEDMEEDEARDRTNNRAEAQAMMNTLNDMNVDFGALLKKDPSFGLKLDELDMKLGYEPGFLRAAVTQGQGLGKVIGHGLSEDNTQAYVTYQGANGMPVTKVAPSGLPRSSGKATEGDKDLSEILTIEKKLNASRGPGGFVDLPLYQSERLRARISPDEFDERFGSFLSDSDQFKTGIKKLEVKADTMRILDYANV